MDTGFVKAESTNLPRIDALMVGEFFALNPDFCSAEQRNDKASIYKNVNEIIDSWFFQLLLFLLSGRQLKLINA
ncbi:hypothetical protein evm_006606 [Chilo suppressalis]|nr:hypothetical protein evm_006606 [Chilo suppressalis]